MVITKGILMFRNILVVLYIALCPLIASGATFCAKSDKVVLGTGYNNAISTGYVGSGFDWRININGFGTVSGVVSCSTLKPDTTNLPLHSCAGPNYISGAWGQTAASNGDVNDNFYGRNDGENCWCKMTHPFESGWIHFYIYNRKCSENCASECAMYLSKRGDNKGNDLYGSKTWQCMLATVGYGD
jgi:hypothetical protein